MIAKIGCPLWIILLVLPGRGGVDFAICARLSVTGVCRSKACQSCLLIPSPKIETFIDPHRSPTFRKGKIGGWRESFTDEHKHLFKEIAGDLLIRLGYEADFDW